MSPKLERFFDHNNTPTMTSNMSKVASRLPLRCSRPLLMCLLVVSLWMSCCEAKEAEKTLAEVAAFLRHGDNRLVRPSPTDETWENQRTEACGADLERAYNVLVTEKKDTQALIDAVTVVSLCTTNNSENRAKLTTKPGVPEAIVGMLKLGNAATAAAAGECIWISSFNSSENYEAFVKAGAVDALSGILTSTTPCEGKSCHHAKMWSAAALQNLAATYCEGGGYCDWLWVTRQEGEHLSDGEEIYYDVKLSESAKPKNDPTPVREELLNNKELLKVISEEICELGATVDMHPSERMWPSRANVPDDIDHPDIVPWAYLGLIKNIAFAKGSHERLTEDMIDCICEYAVHSPDWLENSKAHDALWNLGWKEDQFCEPVYYDDECENDESWVDADGNGCDIYEEERWCAEWGESSTNEGGVSADEACCACGGGTELHQEF